ncbi:MAG TPA: cyclic nucleotide-binding domain-containing protein, partial [Candidatus Limnocylindrales bacterium]|nr:cyclic nucleotide-binding domain-containing protein [Candidatus Limnocylindrales bacterium]
MDRRTELLGGCPLFAGVSGGDLGAIGDRALEVDFPADHVIARQGEIGTGFFVIVEGAVRVVRDGEELATLGPGD